MRDTGFSRKPCGKKAVICSEKDRAERFRPAFSKKFFKNFFEKSMAQKEKIIRFSGKKAKKSRPEERKKAKVKSGKRKSLSREREEGKI